MELQETSSLMRTMTSCMKVPGHSTCDTRPLAQASWAVSFLPLNSISLAYSEGQGRREVGKETRGGGQGKHYTNIHLVNIKGKLA